MIGRAIVVGEVVSPSEATFVVADVRRMWILLDVRKEDANLVRLGQNVAFSADGIPGQVQGQIDWISTEVDQYARTLQVRAEVNNPSLDSASPASTGADQGERRLLRARTFGTGEIRIRDNPQAVVVPSEAVQFDGVSHIVFVRDGESVPPLRGATGCRARRTDRDHRWTQARRNDCHSRQSRAQGRLATGGLRR